MRYFQKPRAGMVISGSGPNLGSELCAQSLTLVFPIQICSIVAPIQVIGFSHSPLAPLLVGHDKMVMP